MLGSREQQAPARGRILARRVLVTRLVFAPVSQAAFGHISRFFAGAEIR